MASPVSSLKMEFIPLDITVLSAKDLKNVNLMTTMDVYAIVSISGDPRTIQKTPVDKEGGTSPKWKCPMKFDVDASAATSNYLSLVFVLMSERSLGDRVIGKVHVPIKELLESVAAGEGKSSEIDAKERPMSYDVTTPKGKKKGMLEFSFRFGEKYTRSVPPPFTMDIGVEPVMAYPSTAQPGPSTAEAYPAPPPGGYPPYPPPQQGYGGCPPQYSYPPQGYGYAQPPPVQQAQPPKSGSKFGLGLAGGLLGGLLIGDMMDHAGAYDAGYDNGYDNGFDDGFDGGFDF